MKKFVLFAALLSLFSSCSSGVPDPVHEAIKGEIMGNMSQEFSSVSINSVEKIDSTTFRQELERRKTVFTTKRDADGDFLLKYMTEGKKRNAALKSESYKRDLVILQGLDSLEEAHAADVNSVAWCPKLEEDGSRLLATSGDDEIVKVWKVSRA